MPTSREQDVAAQIKQATIECEKAQAAYRRGAGADRVNACNRRLGELHQELWRVAGGLVSNYDRPAR